jgi:rRNA maturation RNase YbeY
MAIIQFFSADVGIPSFKRKQLRQFLPSITNEYGMELQDITYIFCSDDYLLDINKRFLAHDYYTDIISFNLAEEKNEVRAELYISVERVKDNAKCLKVAFQQELHRVIFHGLLHMCGFKDKTKAQQKVMRQTEERWLGRYFT